MKAVLQISIIAVVYQLIGFSFPKLPVGQVVENIVCVRDGSQSYALYLPSNYNPEKKWPVLFALDPAARGSLPVRIFREAAERYGYIVVGSNNSQNGPMVVGFNALGAMWEDVSDLLSVDPKRVYLTGFSGGARMAGEFAQLGRSVAGLIACGAGFTLKRKADVPFVFIGISGTRDMNYLEMKNLTAGLLGRQASSRLITFDGGHQWPPTAATVEALEWLQLASFRKGLAQLNQDLVDDLFRREVERAEKLEGSDRLSQAYQIYLDLQRDFEGIKDLEEIGRRSTSLKQNERLGESTKQLKEAEKIESRYIERLLREFLSKDRTRSQAWWRRQIKEIEALDSGYELEKRRLLEFIWRNAYEKSWLAEKEGDSERAVYLAQVALLGKPKDPHLYLNLARFQALDDNFEAALESLGQAIALGYTDRNRIESDPAFGGLHNAPEFGEILDQIEN